MRLNSEVLASSGLNLNGTEWGITDGEGVFCLVFKECVSIRPHNLMWHIVTD